MNLLRIADNFPVILFAVFDRNLFLSPPSPSLISDVSLSYVPANEAVDTDRTYCLRIPAKGAGGSQGYTENPFGEKRETPLFRR